MAARGEYPLLKMAVMSEVVREYETDVSLFNGAAFCPVKNYMRDLIEWDVLYGAQGMTPPVYPDSPTPIRKHPKVGHKSFKTVQWREKSIISEEDLITLRRPGSYDDPYAMELLGDLLSNLNIRLETRIEYLRYQMLTGSTTITYEDGSTRAIDYEVPSANKPTVTTGWATVATATPHTDVQAWKLLFRGTGAKPSFMRANTKTLNYVRNNDAVQDIVQYQFGYDLIRAGRLVPDTALTEVFEGLRFEEDDHGYVNESGTFTPFIADDRVILFGEGPEQRCDFATTPSMYTGAPRPVPGKFARPLFYLEDDPVRIEVIVGMYGLPRMPHPNWHLYADVS